MAADGLTKNMKSPQLKRWMDDGYLEVDFDKTKSKKKKSTTAFSPLSHPRKSCRCESGAQNMFTHVQLGVIALTLGSSMPESVLLFFCRTSASAAGSEDGQNL